MDTDLLNKLRDILNDTKWHTFCKTLKNMRNPQMKFNNVKIANDEIKSLRNELITYKAQLIACQQALFNANISLMRAEDTERRDIGVFTPGTKNNPLGADQWSPKTDCRVHGETKEKPEDFPYTECTCQTEESVNTQYGMSHQEANTTGGGMNAPTESNESISDITKAFCR